MRTLGNRWRSFALSVPVGRAHKRTELLLFARDETGRTMSPQVTGLPLIVGRPALRSPWDEGGCRTIFEGDFCYMENVIRLGHILPQRVEPKSRDRLFDVYLADM